MYDEEGGLLGSFLKMVQIASHSGREGKFAEYLQGKMEELGLEVLVDTRSALAAGTESGNLIGRLTGSCRQKNPLLLAAHMDTVFHEEDIRPVVKDGVIFSYGHTILGSDDKAGIAVLLEAIRRVKEKGSLPRDIEVVFTFGEEKGLRGSRNLDYSLILSREGFVLDGTGEPGTIYNGGPAINKISAVITGKAAHAGINPEEGISAIQAAAEAVSTMKLLRIDSETTANIGIISGGNATNIVCDRVELKGETRSLSEAKLQDQTGHMIGCLEKACEKYGCKLTLEDENKVESFYVGEEQDLIQIARAAARKIDLPVNLAYSCGASDANIFNAHGIRMVNLGIGMENVHTQDEKIKVADLEIMAAYITAIIEG